MYWIRFSCLGRYGFPNFFRINLRLIQLAGKMGRFIFKIVAFSLRLIVFFGFIPLALLVLPISWGAITLVVLSYIAGIGVWLSTVQGKLYWVLKSQKSRLIGIALRGYRKRKMISDSRDRRNMADLIKIVQNTLNDRKDKIPIHIWVRIRLMLQECKKDLDFNKAMRLYQILVEVEPTLLGDVLNRQNT